MLSESLIKQYGGKGAIVNYVKDSVPKMPIPNYVIKEYKQPVTEIISDFKSMKKPVIVRSSSPYEYEDFEGIFESHKNVYTEDDLRYAIEAVEKSAMSERAQLYAKQNGFKVGKEMNVIIQEQSDSRYTGAMMRHPNNPDRIFITRFLGEGSSYRKQYATLFYDGKNDNWESFSSLGIGKISREDAIRLIEEYKKTESLTDITDDKVLYVEFGDEPFRFYQARPFKKKETADFEIKTKSDPASELYTDLTFGVTPEDGIVYPVLRSLGDNDGRTLADHIAARSYDMEKIFKERDYGLGRQLLNIGLVAGMTGMGIQKITDMAGDALKAWHDSAELEFNGKPYCLLTSCAHKNTYDTDLSVPNMRGLVIGDASNFLVHDLMRLFKKADVTLARTSSLLFHDFHEFYENTKSFIDKVRIRSNGREAIVTRE